MNLLPTTRATIYVNDGGESNGDGSGGGGSKEGGKLIKRALDFRRTDETDSKLLQMSKKELTADQNNSRRLKNGNESGGWDYGGADGGRNYDGGDGSLQVTGVVISSFSLTEVKCYL